MQRKVVTVFFSDLVGSTELGERLDTEALRRLLTRYFDEVRDVLERHGATVEKYIGDAVVALFGVPVAREDDALRALRAASEIRGRVARLNDELERGFGVRIAVRTGIHTGEVLVDANPARPGLTASGDTMNVAARLEQSAEPDEILIGEQTRALGGNAIVVDEIEPLTVRGKAEPLHAYRLVDVLQDVAPHARRDDVPLVGRQRELASLRKDLSWATDNRACFLATIVAPPGIGKSRLARELLADLGDSRVLIGRCPADTEGRSFLPLAEALRPVLGAPAEARAHVLVHCASDERAEAIADRVASAMETEDTAGATEETFWALRRLFEALATDRPLVLALDDVHWAEAILLDLVEYVAGISRGFPIFILCLTRPDLLDDRPKWATPRENTSLTLLGPLADDESIELVSHLSPERTIGAHDLGRIVDAAEGNPLFLEQLLALNAGRDAGAPLDVPPTIHALLQARLDGLVRPERLLLEAASVEGRVFKRSTVAALVSPRDDESIGAGLVALARKQFVRALRRDDGAQETFAFGHALIRDAAYAVMPKEVRADLHERLAAHLEAKDSEPVEVVGHHLALAARYRRELGEDDERTATLARRAAEYLTSGGRRALAAGDDQAAARLLDHAASLVGIDDRLGREARGELGRAFTGTGQLERARVTFANVRDGARSQGERALALRAELGLANFRVQTDPTMSNAEITKVAEDAIPVFEAEGDEYGLAFSWFLIHWGLFRGGRYEESIAAAEEAIAHAKTAGDLREQFRALGAIAMAHLWGPTPVSEAEQRLDELLERSGHARLMEAFAVRVRGGFCSMTGDFERGRELCNHAIEIYGEFGHQLSALGVVVELQRVERKAGRLDVAEEGLRTAYEAAAGLGDLGYVSWIAATLARVLADQRRFDEALAVVDRPDLNLHFGFTNVIVQVVRAEASAAEGKRREAEAHALEALRLIETTDILDLHGDVLMYLAELDEAAGRDVEAANRVADAIVLYERKGDVVSAERARARAVPLGA